MPYHAFYSEKQKNFHINLNNTITNVRISTYGIPITYNYITRGNSIIETTSVFDTNLYPMENNCPIIYDDKVYLGIVEKFHSPCFKL